MCIRNSFCISIRTLTSRLYFRTTWVSQTPPTQCAVFEYQKISSTLLTLPLSFAHHMPVNHHNIPHLHQAYLPNVCNWMPRTLIDRSDPHNVQNPPCDKTIYSTDLIL